MVRWTRRWSRLAVLSAGVGTAALAQGPSGADEAPAEVAPETAAPSPEDAAASADPSANAAAPAWQTLASLIALAEERYPGLEAADSALDAAEERLDEARSSPFGQFTVDLGAALVPNAAGTPIYTPNGQLGNLSAWGPAASVQFSGALPIYTFGKLREAWRAAEAGITAAEHGRERVERQLTFDVRRAYFGLTFALDVRQMIREGESKLVAALESFDTRIEEGDDELDPMDRYRLAAALAEIRARRSQAEYAEGAARAALEALTGRTEITIADCPSEAVAISLPSPDELAAEVESRPELAMLRAAVVARRAELAVHRARYYPDLALGLSATYSTTPGVTDIANPFVSDRANNRGLGFGLGARWSLDFAGNRHRVLRARAQLAEIRAQYAEATLGAELEVRVATERLADADRRVAAWTDGERQARQWFVASLQGYQVGTMEARALVESLKAYFGARYSRLEAVLDHNLALTQLERISGRTLAESEAWEPTCE